MQFFYSETSNPRIYQNEHGPNYNLTDRVRLHDRYDSGGHIDATVRYRAEPASACCHSST